MLAVERVLRKFKVDLESLGLKVTRSEPSKERISKRVTEALDLESDQPIPHPHLKPALPASRSYCNE